MTTVQQLMEAGYLRSTANDAGKIADDPELIPFLNRTYQHYAALLATAAPERWVSVVSGTWQAGPPPFYTLPADVIDIHRIEDGTGNQIHLFPVREKGRAWVVAPACWREGPNLKSRAQTGDPSPGDAVTLWVLDAPATLAAAGSSLDPRWPVRHDELLVLDVAIYLSVKDEGRPVEEYNELIAERKLARQAFYALNGIVHTATETPHDPRRIPAVGAEE